MAKWRFTVTAITYLTREVDAPDWMRARRTLEEDVLPTVTPAQWGANVGHVEVTTIDKIGDSK